MSNASDVIQRMRTQQRLAVQNTGKRVLFNPGTEPVTFTYSGDPYTLPPNGPYRMNGEPGFKNYNGELEVYDVYGVDPSQARAARIAKKQSLKNGTPFAVPKKMVISSLDIVDHAVRKLAGRGIVCLTGDPVEDKELRVQAQEAWVSFRLNDCEQIMARYDAKKAVFYSQPRNSDQPPPPMTERETEAAVWLAQWRLGRAYGVNKFVCPGHQCGFQHEDRDFVASHIQAFHPENQGELMSNLPETIEEKPAKRGPGRPKKEDA